MAGVRIVVDAIEAEQKNAEGGRTITVSGRTSSKAVGYCALTFSTAADLKKLKMRSTPPRLDKALGGSPRAWL